MLEGTGLRERGASGQNSFSAGCVERTAASFKNIKRRKKKKKGKQERGNRSSERGSGSMKETSLHKNFKFGRSS